MAKLHVVQPSIVEVVGNVWSDRDFGLKRLWGGFKGDEGPGDDAESSCGVREDGSSGDGKELEMRGYISEVTVG